MTDRTERQGHGLGWVRPLAWGLGAAFIVVPLALMFITEEQNWGAGDFMFAAIMVGGVGLAFELAVRISKSWSYRAGFAIALVAAFLLIWGNLAVGFVGSEDNPLNLIYFGVVGLAVLGSALVLLRASGMRKVMAATALAQIAAGGVALYFDYFTGPLTTFFTALWLASTWLFRKAARE